MVNFLISALYLVIMFAVLLGIIMLCKKWVFTKIRINKFIPLAVAIIGFAIQLFVRPEGMVIQMTGGPKKSNEKKIVIKPKAKPNRLKNQKND
ncbi:hypothetical protein [Clostridium sp.]|uniref:hypothetical protein n=1 Tax=Clostridium sp. TaxID=1506 RepID=UPI0029079F29|nr:hypothetical protein [Clostridium sp.]MDU3353257.1 hypothetical protein [Clostridium sp.]